MLLKKMLSYHIRSKKQKKKKNERKREKRRHVQKIYIW